MTQTYNKLPGMTDVTFCIPATVFQSALQYFLQGKKLINCLILGNPQYTVIKKFTNMEVRILTVFLLSISAAFFTPAAGDKRKYVSLKLI